MIVEILGRPAEHVKESLKNHVEQMYKLKDIEVFSISVNEPIKIEEHQDAYSCFSEVEFSVPSFLRLLELIFDFMPSSIEIISPSEVKMSAFDATCLANNLTGRLHKYDEIAKMAQMYNQQLVKKMQEMHQQTEVKQKSSEKKKVVKSKKKKKN